MRIGLFLIAMFATTGAASAQATLSIPLDAGTADSVTSQTYSCGAGEEFAVQYINSGANALAIFPIDGQERIFVNVVSGSGAKYASGAHVWWTKGNDATLENELEEGSIQNCQSQDAAQPE